MFITEKLLNDLIVDSLVQLLNFNLAQITFQRLQYFTSSPASQDISEQYLVYQLFHMHPAKLIPQLWKNVRYLRAKRERKTAKLQVDCPLPRKTSAWLQSSCSTPAMRRLFTSSWGSRSPKNSRSVMLSPSGMYSPFEKFGSPSILHRPTTVMFLSRNRFTT